LSVSDYHIVWDRPSADHDGSMPLGNGDLTANAWVEPSGDLVFFIGKTDAWDENGRLLKVGKVRVRCEPPLVEPNATFRQELDLTRGTMRVEVRGTDGAARLALSVDAHHPCIDVAIESDQPRRATASFELWRKTREALPSLEISDVLFDREKPGQMREPVFVEPDTVLANIGPHIGWYHHNTRSTGPALAADIQGVADFPRVDPLLHRTFGAIITADAAQRVDDTTLGLPAVHTHHIRVHLLTRHPSTVEAWRDDILAQAARIDAIPLARRRTAHEAWWRDFWDRSWIKAWTRGGKTEDDDAFIVSRGYALQRYLTVCAGRGRHPIKFNGSIFTVPAENTAGYADYRRWGPGYWWQNTRLPYVSLCASGDTDFMEPLWRMYVDDLLPLNRHRTKSYFGIDGAFYPECVYFWGDVFSEAYGWTPMTERKDPLQESQWHKWEWVAGPELVYMMLDAYDHTGDESLLRRRILPTALAVIRFFDGFYTTDAAGKLVMHPSQALETWWDCTNPMPEVAGLHAICARLRALPEGALDAANAETLRAFQAKLPDLPVRDTEDGSAFAPAERFAIKKNMENAELYSVFPFRLASFNRTNAPLAVRALKHRWNRGNTGWRQDDIFMAYLGLTDDARSGLVARARAHDERSRFPAFWGPNFDWTPDQDHGGVLMKTFQSMLMQTEPVTGSEVDGKIYLLPAWPRDWDADFKLHAPGNTTISGRVRDGKIENIVVTPSSRKKDVVIVRGTGEGIVVTAH